MHHLADRAIDLACSRIIKLTQQQGPGTEGDEKNYRRNPNNEHVFLDLS